MRKRSLVILVLLSLSILACGGRFVRGGGPPGIQPLATATRVPTQVLLTPAATTTPPAPRTPAPTLDLGAYLLTQAYAGQTPRGTGVQPLQSPQGLTLNAPTTEPAATTAPTSVSLNPLPTLTPTTGAQVNPPASAIVSGPVLIPNAVNTATCKIRNVGDCKTGMAQGVTLFFTWTFGVRSSEVFQWGNAAVIIERDGQPFKWSQTNNGLRPPPKEGETSRLLTGQQAEFRAALDSAEPGAYTARLTMCLSPVADCNAGSGWQDVGGDVITVVITP